MPDPAPNTSTTDGNNTSGATSAAGDEFKPITSQDELNRIIGERVKRAKPADYDELRSKAARLEEIEQANQSEKSASYKSRGGKYHGKCDCQPTPIRPSQP